MKAIASYIQAHKKRTWILLSAYFIFNSCFQFPLSNELFSFNFFKAFMLLVAYGLSSAGLALLLGEKKTPAIFLLTISYTAVGMFLRYVLEYGEYSNTINFIPKNIASYLLLIPCYCTIIYHLTPKENNT